MTQYSMTNQLVQRLQITTPLLPTPGQVMDPLVDEIQRIKEDIITLQAQIAEKQHLLDELVHLHETQRTSLSSSHPNHPGLELRTIRVSCACHFRDKKRIKKAFSKYGQLSDIRILERTNQPQCLITFATIAEARKAYKHGSKLVIAGVNDERHRFTITLERTEVQKSDCFDSDRADLQEPLPVSPKVIIGEVIQKIYGYPDTHRWYGRIMNKIFNQPALEFQSMIRSPELIRAAVISARNEVSQESRDYWNSVGRG